MKNIIQLIRVKHWIKNTFLFIPSFFGGKFFEFKHIIDLLIGFFAFSFIASSIYIINDYKDIDADQAHPQKKYRPLASGAISKKTGVILFFILLFTGFMLGNLLNFYFLIILLIYFLLNVAYSLGLKNISILDIIIVAIGFELRVKAGGLLAEIYVTEWLTIMIFLLALFLALAKRRDDILIKNKSGLDMRKTIKSYNLDFVTSSLTMVSGVIIVSYLLYTQSSDLRLSLSSNKLFYTSIFVIAGMLRYNQIIYVDNKSGSPVDIIFKDKFIICTLLAWIIYFLFLIYLT